MALPKGHPKYGGRQKGTPNKISRDVRRTIIETFDAIGGEAAYREWAEANKDKYFEHFRAMAPKSIEASVEHSWRELVDAAHQELDTTRD